MFVERNWVTPIAAGAFLLAGVVLHVLANFGGFKRHFLSRAGLGVMSVFALALALVAHRTPQQLRNTLSGEGLRPSSDDQTLGELAGPDMRKRMRLLEKLLPAPSTEER